MKPIRTYLIRTLHCSAVVCALALNAAAANLTWDGSGNGTNPNTSGTWNTTGTNWNNGTGLTTWNNANNDTAVFGNSVGSGGTRVVTLGEDITVGGIGFASPGGFTIAGSNILTLAGSTPTITLTVNGTISATIAGSNGLIVQAGAASKFLALTGLNTYTGVTNVGSGLTLTVNTLANGGSASSIGAGSSAASDLVLGGTLSYIGAGSSTDRLFTINNTAVTLASNGTGAVNFTNTGHLVVATAASTTLTLSGTNTGNNILSAAIDNPTAGSTKIVKTGAGNWGLFGDNSYTGITTIAGGTLSANTLANGGSNSSIGASGNAATNLVIDGGALKYVGTGGSTDRLFTVAKDGATLDASGTGAVNFTNTGNIAYGTTNPTTTRTLTLAGTNTGNNTLAAAYGDKGSGTSVSALIKTGAGKWIITGAHTYTGGTRVSEGTLVLGSATTLQSATGNVVVNGGTLSSNVTNTVIGSDVALTSGFITPGDAGIGIITLAAGKDFSMTGGEIQLTLGASYDQFAGGAGSNFTLTAGTIVLDVTGAGFSYSNGYTLFSGFDTIGNVVSLGDGTTGLMISGYDTNSWTAQIDVATGVLTFGAVPEPGSTALLGLSLLLCGSTLLRRRKQG